MPRRLAWFSNKKKTVHMPEVVLTSHQFHMVIKQLVHLPPQKNAQQVIRKDFVAATMQSDGL